MSQIPQNRSCWHGPWKRKKKEYGFTYAESFALLKVGISLFLINAFMKTCGGAVLSVIPETLNLDQNTCFFPSLLQTRSACRAQNRLKRLKYTSDLR